MIHPQQGTVMIKSMTGFGRAEYTDEKRKFTVEIKSVNHRYLDCSIKMPKKLSFFETSIRTLLKDYIQRGKVDVFITYEDYTTGIWQRLICRILRKWRMNSASRMM